MFTVRLTFSNGRRSRRSDEHDRNPPSSLTDPFTLGGSTGVLSFGVKRKLGGVATAIHVHRHRGDKIGTCHPEEAVRRDTDGRLYTYPEYVAFYGSDAPAAWAAAAHP